ncbi:MAG: hypothetical protein GY832_08920 [Chloroflexi bacterium]|nr:hypothetical protein [Chloroflexota bacterium]
MADRLMTLLHGTQLALTSDRDDFLTFARAYLDPLLDPTDARPDISVALEWEGELESQPDLERLGRRIWAGPQRIRYAEIWQAPGLQIDVSWPEEPDAPLALRAAYVWPTRRAKWFARLMPWARERLFVALIYYLVYFPCAWWLEHRRGWTLVHASALATSGGGLTFSGLPGCGKSTTALAALNAPESQIVSDNLLFTDGHQVYACPEPIHVDEKTRTLVGDLAGRVRPTGREFSHRRQDYEIAPEARRSSTTPLALGFLHVGRETSVRPVDRAVAARRLMANDFLAKEWMAYQESAAAMHQVWPSIGDHERRWENVATLAQSIPCFDVTVARDGQVQQEIEQITRAMLNG